MEPDHWIAYALDLPGCFSSAATPEEAVRQAPERIAAHLVWRAEHDCSFPVADGPIGVDVVETFTAFPSSADPAYIVNAFFADDQRPLANWEIRMGLQVLDWTRQDLRAVIQSIPVVRRSSPPPRPAARETPADLLRHIADAENWYFSQLGLALAADQIPLDPPARLDTVRANIRQQLPALAGDDRITTSHDERWSARKILRRTLWHERDHTRQITCMLAASPLNR